MKSREIAVMRPHNCPKEMYQIDQPSYLGTEYDFIKVRRHSAKYLSHYDPAGRWARRFFFGHERSAGAPMVKISPSPDARYGVTLSNRASTMGARRLILKTAVEAGKEGISVAIWIVPGRHKLRRRHGAELLLAEYARQMLALPPKETV